MGLFFFYVGAGFGKALLIRLFDLLLSGLQIVMRQSKTWWYQTQHFWVGACFVACVLLGNKFLTNFSNIEYPYWQMTPLMKTYYLLHSAYWLQQLFVLVLGLEKPRKDFSELVLHHLVTLWLIG
jgi:very-long-chain ceramide synthase